MVQEHKGPGRPRKDGLDERIIAAVLTVLYLVYHPLLVTFFGTKF